MIDAKASAKASSKSGKVRGLSERSRAFTFDQQFSLGFRSGEDGGRNNTHAENRYMEEPAPNILLSLVIAFQCQFDGKH